MQLDSISWTDHKPVISKQYAFVSISTRRLRTDMGIQATISITSELAAKLGWWEEHQEKHPNNQKKSFGLRCSSAELDGKKLIRFTGPYPLHSEGTFPCMLSIGSSLRITMLREAADWIPEIPVDKKMCFHYDDVAKESHVLIFELPTSWTPKAAKAQKHPIVDKPLIKEAAPASKPATVAAPKAEPSPAANDAPPAESTTTHLKTIIKNARLLALGPSIDQEKNLLTVGKKSVSVPPMWMDILSKCLTLQESGNLYTREEIFYMMREAATTYRVQLPVNLLHIIDKLSGVVLQPVGLQMKISSQDYVYLTAASDSNAY